MRKTKLLLNSFLVLGLIFLLTGCGAVHTSIAKKDLDVQTRVSKGIFVDPVAKERRKVHMEIRSSIMEFDRRAFTNYVNDQFSNHNNGYTLVDNPDEAQYLMNVFVLNLEKSTPEKANQALGQGFMGAAGGAGVGAIAGGAAGGVAGGVLGGLLATALEASVQDVYYMLVADVQVQEKTNANVHRSTNIQTEVSESGSSTQRVTEIQHKKEYKTRIVTTANKANLELTEAQELMFQKTAYAMAGFF